MHGDQSAHAPRLAASAPGSAPPTCQSALHVAAEAATALGRGQAEPGTPRLAEAIERFPMQPILDAINPLATMGTKRHATTGEPYRPSLRERVEIGEALYQAAHDFVGKADDYLTNAEYGTPTGDQSDFAKRIALSDAARYTLLARQCVAAAEHMDAFVGFTVAETGRFAQDNLIDAVVQWCVLGCPEPEICIKCRGPMERIDDGRDEANCVAEAHGLRCTHCEHWLPDDGDAPRHVGTACEKPRFVNDLDCLRVILR